MTKKNESQANTQAFLAAGGTQEQLAGEKYGKKLSTNELNRFIQKYGLTGNEVYSARNLTATPAVAPDDLLGIRNQLYSELGVTAAQQAYQQALKDLMDYQSGLESQQLAIEGQPLSMNVIRGEQAQASQLGAQQVAAKSRALQVLQNELQSKMQEAETQYRIRAQQVQETRQLMLQYPGAGIKYGDSMEKIQKKITDYQKEQEKKAYKDELKKMALQLGISAKGRSAREIEEEIRKYYSSEKEYTKTIRDLEIKSKQKALAQIGRGGGGAAATKAALRQEGIQGFQSIFETIKGPDGYVNPTDYKAARSQWVANGLSASEFDSIFEPYRNPYDKLYGTKYLKPEKKNNGF
jgi:hypothetical protein